MVDGHPDRSLGFAQVLEQAGVEERLQLGSRIGFCAYHGGNLERQTEVIAAEAARLAGASYYAVVQPDSMRYHVSSTKVDPSVSERFSTFMDHCDVVVTVHGYGRRGHFTSLLCGGGNRGLATHVADHLRSTLPAYRTIDDPERIPPGLRGLHSRNPCNLPRKGGMQLELPPRVRGLSPLADHWPAARGPDRFPHVSLLIDALATAAATWPVPR